MSTTLSVRVSPEMAAELQKLAESTDRPKSWHLEQALSEYLRIQAWQIEHIEKALEQAKAGKTVPHAEVKRRFKSWIKSHKRKAV